MNISIASVFPELYEPFLNTSLIKRAQENGIISINTMSFFRMVAPKERIDAPTFGPGAGMVIKPTVVQKAIDTLEEAQGKALKVFFSPHGKKLTQPLLKKITKKAQEKGHIILVPARYEGMDARVEETYADEIISVGDFVLMGGDIPAMMLLEGMLRLVPGIVGKEESVEQDSFSGPWVDYPAYTEPVEWQGMRVPDIVRSGNHAAIESWRLQQAVERTVKHHFSWLRLWHLTPEQKKVALPHIPSHYVALMHSDVLIGPERHIGTTSVTSIDIHDIARSSATYAIEKFFIVTPLKDQQKIVNHFLSFWQEGMGVEYNKNRHEALDRVKLEPTLDAVIADITAATGKAPLLIVTSARPIEGKKSISFYDQTLVWQENRPVLLLFGTGRGLADTIVQRADYVLNPINGLSPFNHLSVRSAVGIILDRWLGLNEYYAKNCQKE
jgi:tRNA (guanine37-N1)-methyltransferase